MIIDQLTIRRPDDWHVHLRDGPMLKAVLPYTISQFARAIVMPNLPSPITTASSAEAYRQRILENLPSETSFTPLMTAYLTDGTDPAEIDAGFSNGTWIAAKLYPAKATTNSAFGVTDIGNVSAVLGRMERIGMPLLIHGEVTDSDVDIFDREAVFVDRVLAPLRGRFPGLRIVLEHVTTKEGADYVAESEPGIGATVTPHHLILNRNALFAGGLRPHAYCLPVAKRESHRRVLCHYVTSGHERFFLGTDTAPHHIAAKESDCGCAGIFCAPFAIEAYASVFDKMGAMDKLEAFASINGPAFYGLSVNETTITLQRRDSKIPTILAEEVGGLRPFMAGETIGWERVV